MLVEDDRLDVMVVRRVLKEFHVSNELVHVEDGERALAYLKDGHHERPCVILLDVNMPKMNGFEFLEALRADNALQDISVVMVTTSPDIKDVRRSLELGAVAYVIKSPSYGEFREGMRVIEDYVTKAHTADEGLKQEAY